MKPGDRIRIKRAIESLDQDILATIVRVESNEITVIIDGYSCSDTFLIGDLEMIVNPIPER